MISLNTSKVEGHPLHIIVGGDYKVIIDIGLYEFSNILFITATSFLLMQFLPMVMGMNEAHATYACLWCTIPACDR